MKKLVYILLSALIFACSSENTNDCFQTSGNIVQQDVIVPNFRKILVNREVELIIKEGLETKVVIETGENLLNDVTAKVIGDELQLTDNNICNYVRDYGITKVFVTAPNITEIRNSSQYTVSSNGLLNYNAIKLISENFLESEAFAVGDFRLQINSNSLSITSNNIASFYISGQVNNLSVGFFAGACRFEGENLIAQNVDIFHRGSNDMIVNPQQSITGELRSTGNVIAKSKPPTITVEHFYTGRLIFEN